MLITRNAAAGDAQKRKFSYQWGTPDARGINGSKLPMGSYVFNFHGQTACCVQGMNGSVVGICGISNGKVDSASYSWLGHRQAVPVDQSVRLLYLVPAGKLSNAQSALEICSIMSRTGSKTFASLHFQLSAV